ncbi:T3SS effector HopA1 family protein [Streptomyces chryseus]
MTASVISRILSAPDVLDGLAAREEAEARQEIYRRFHLAGTVPADAGHDDDVTLLDTARTRLADRYRSSAGWAYHAALGDGRWVVRRDDGLTVIAAFGDIEGVDAGQVTLRVPGLEPGVMNGWLWFHGRNRPEGDEDLTVRVYLSLPGQERGRWWSTLVARLDELGYAFSSKIIRRAGERGRPDGVVVYCRPQDLSGLLTETARVLPADELGAHTAGFAVAVSEGVSVAVPQEGEDPQASMGMHRAETIVKALADGRRGEEAVAEVARVLELQDAQVADLLRDTRI